MIAPDVVDAPAPLYRVGRSKGPLHFSRIDALDADLARVGSRFDVLGGGVMYAATERIGAYKESIAFARPATSEYNETGWHMPAGTLPADWRDKRRMVSFQLTEALPFLDVESDATLTHLTEAMADELASLNVATLDQAVVRGPDRLITRAIAAYAYTAVDENDEALYSGVRYCSRFQSHECWAIFEGVEFGDVGSTTIESSDSDLRQAARVFNLTVH